MSAHPAGRTAVATGFGLVLAGAFACATHAASPYPASPVIETITWHEDTHDTAAPGSDLWPVTWGSDGNIYTSWGDGGGFGGTNSDGRVSIGFARIEGSQTSWTGINVNGGKNAENPASIGKGKSAGMISVDGTLYAWINTQNSSTPDYKLAWSADLGATWQQSSWTFSSGTFTLGSFLNFGKDNAGARDGYVYHYGGKWGANVKETYLARVPKAQMKTKSAYECFAGLDGNGQPTWTSNMTNRAPVFTHPNSPEFNGAKKIQVVYNPAIQRYILTRFHNGVGGMGIYDAPEPWGPWTTVAYYDSWRGMANSGEGLTCSFPRKWMSADGKTMWCVFSVYSSGGAGDAHDRFNLIKTTLTLKQTQTDTTPPSAPTGLAASASGSQVSLSWTAASDGESGISGYRVYRGVSSGGEALLTQTGNVTSYTDSSTSPGTTYFYKVSAVNGAGLEGAKSNESSASVTGGSGTGPSFSISRSGGCAWVVTSLPSQFRPRPSSRSASWASSCRPGPLQCPPLDTSAYFFLPLLPCRPCVSVRSGPARRVTSV